MYIVYIHTKGLPYYMDFIPDENLFGFDGYDCSSEAGKRFCDSFNASNPERHAYMFSHLRSALEGAAIIKKLNPDIRINLIRKELTHEQCEAVLSTGNLPT